jgi:hypothetical protein
LALGDREFVFDGSPGWTPDFAIHAARAKGLAAVDVGEELQRLDAALEPAPKGWMVDRLSMLMSMFTIGRVSPGAEHIALWMSEYSRLLGDIPHDILGQAIDDAVQSSRHGFMPSVGEIRQHAEPVVAERKQHIERLTRMLAGDWSMPVRGGEA